MSRESWRSFESAIVAHRDGIIALILAEHSGYSS
jgi:hypothetical protein